MVPKLHARGQSFKGASLYLFHDKDRAKTAERVAWSEALNCWSERPEDAWFEMWDTWRERHALKKEHGVDPRGRDNKTPVLHLSLSWHPDETPDRDKMTATAKAALKAIGLEDHQAVLVAHTDEKHPHVHVLVNTVHRFTGQTAALTYSKEALSRWAEGYERDQGQIRCEERVKNNARRRELKEERAAEKTKRDFDQASGKTPDPKTRYEPVKDKSLNRPAWFTKEQIVARMKEMRAELDPEHAQDRTGLKIVHEQQRKALWARTDERLKTVRERIRESYKPEWKRLYRTQRAEKREVEKVARSHPFERAVYVFRNRDKLASIGGRASLKEMAQLIMSPDRLVKRVDALHEAARQSMAQKEKTEQKTFGDRVTAAHRADYEQLKATQKTERDALYQHHQAERAEVTFMTAKADLAKMHEQARTVEHFEKAADPSPAPSKPEPAPDRGKDAYADDPIARQMREMQKKGWRDDFERDR